MKSYHWKMCVNSYHLVILCFLRLSFAYHGIFFFFSRWHFRCVYPSLYTEVSLTVTCRNGGVAIRSFHLFLLWKDLFLFSFNMQFCSWLTFVVFQYLKYIFAGSSGSKSLCWIIKNSSRATFVSAMTFLSCHFQYRFFILCCECFSCNI